jgi:hypothetical protein
LLNDRTVPPFRAHCGSDPQRGTWRGHRPITHEVLLSILQRAAADKDDFSRAERILYMACEFWAAIAARTIAKDLGSDVVRSLQNAIIAFSTIGAMSVVGTLNAALGDLVNAPTNQHRRECLSALERDLSGTKDPVDQLIARFAEKLKQCSDACADRLVSVRAVLQLPSA